MTIFHGRRAALALLVSLASAVMQAHAEDGYDLWLRYPLIADESLRAHYAEAASEIVAPPPGDLPGSLSPLLPMEVRDPAPANFEPQVGFAAATKRYPRDTPMTTVAIAQAELTRG